MPNKAKLLIVAATCALVALVAGTLLPQLYQPRAEANTALYFEDNFDGSSMDTSKWSVSNNGYPAPAVSVANGSVQLGQPGTSSLDFPYVSSLASPFPDAGNFDLNIVAQYTSGASNGDGILVVGPGNERILQIWKDTTATHVFLQGIGSAALAGPFEPHAYKMTYEAGFVSVIVDGTQVLSAAISVRPTNIWFGHATVGEVFFKEGAIDVPGQVDPATGEVLSRWWGNGEWTTFSLDSIRVTTMKATPAPTDTPTDTPTTTETPTVTATDTPTPTATATPCPDYDGDTSCDGTDADDDNDGCPDARELVTGPGAQNSGGNRDPLNGNDYFNPTYDGENRVDDILAVVDQYFIDQGNPGYSPDTDRTLVGPNAWNLGPPNDLQRVDDILNIVHQYYHDCA